MPVNRRSFVKAAGAVVVASQTSLSYGNISGSNEPLRFGVIGFRGRGKSLINAINAADNAKLVALCDVDEKALGAHKPEDKSLFRSGDFRKLLERDDIDAIASATPNHWHSMLAIHGALAGKHVYIEKPISHNMTESRAVVAAAEKTGKLIQCGFQNRSDTGVRGFFEGLKAGNYGKVNFVHGTCHRARKTIGKLEKSLDIPKQINYDLWLGPAEDKPVMRPRLHYDWHWDFNTGNGDVGNQGPHEWDMMNWALGDQPGLPTKMTAAGNRFGWGDAGDTPNVMACVGEINSTPFYFEVMDIKPGRGAPHGRGVGVIVETDKGMFVGGRGGGQFRFSDGKVEKFSRDETQKRSDGTNAHMQNFVDCVLANKRSDLRSDCVVAANSSSMAHMANISYRLGSDAQPDQLEAAFSDSVVARDMLARLRESTMIYAMQNKLESIEEWKLGPTLTFSNDKAEFTGSEAAKANELMTRQYRKNFELPKIG